jgi:hypothetical protein
MENSFTVLLRQRLFPGLFVATGVLGLIGQRQADYLSQLPNCPIKAVVGFDCPACGSGRCMSALANGDLLQAVDENLLMTAVVAGSVVIAMIWLIKGSSFSANLQWARLLSLLTATTGLFWVARVIPWQVGEWLNSGTYQQ